ncbi:MAG: BatD family protein [Mariprofundaceae bacterium]|nr:BatD family protein [Mariprofundaceae bacterium]
MQRFLYFFCALFLLPMVVYADALTASIDRNQMHIGESLQLTLTLKGSADSPPDFTPLKQQFEWVGQNKSSSIQIINGSMNRSTQWTIALMPRKTGMLSIPPIHAGALVSARIHLQVLPDNQTTTGQAADVFLEVTALPQDVYVQQQVLFSVRLFRAIDLAQAQLSEPDVIHASIERLGKDATYKTQRQGRDYTVTERRYAIFPQRHGTMTIPALEFSGRTSSSTGFFMQAGRVLRKSSPAITVNVRAIPSLWPASSDWLPASHLVLHEEGLSAASIHVGDALTRKIYIKATGLTAAQLPQLSGESIPDSFRQYPDQPSLTNKQTRQGMIGVREEKIALIATQSGNFTLPAIRLAWWNTSTGRIEMAEIPARVVSVLPAIGQTNVQSPLSMPSVKHPEAPLVDKPINSTPLKTNPMQWTGWPIVAAMLAVAWLLTIAMYFYAPYNGKRKHKQASRLQHESEKTWRKKVLQACRQNDAKRTSHAIMRWVQHMEPAACMNNIPQLATYLQRQDDQWLDALLQLDQYLYGEQKEKPWDGSIVYTLVKTWQPVTVDVAKNNTLPMLL